MSCFRSSPRRWKDISILGKVTAIASIVLLFTCLSAFIFPIFEVILPTVEKNLLHRDIARTQLDQAMLRAWAAVTIVSIITALIAYFFCQHAEKRRLGVASKKDRLWTAAVLACFSMLLCWLVIDYGHNWGGDFSQYISQAIAIVNGTVGQQIESNAFIIENSALGLGPIVYPWGTPLLLAPVYRIFGLDLFALKAAGIVCFGIFVFLIHFFYSGQFRHPYAVYLTLLLSVNSAFITHTNSILSDIPFLLFSTLSIIVLQRMLRTKSGNKQLLWGITFGIMSFCSFQIRSNGIILLITLLCMQILIMSSSLFCKNALLRKVNENSSKPYYPAHVAPYLVFVLLYFALSSYLPGGGEHHLKYVSLISLKGILKNLIYYAKLLKGLFPVPLIPTIFYAASLICFILGVIKVFFKNIPILVYSFGTMLLLILWPATQGLRFLFPLIPFYLLFAAYGGKALFSKSSANVRFFVKSSLTYLCALLLIMTSLTAWDNLSGQRSADYGAFSANAMQSYAYIKENTSDNDIIAFFKPRVLLLNTNRRGFALNADRSNLKKADYLLRSRDDDYEDIVAAENGTDEGNLQFESVFLNDEFELFEIAER